MNPADDRTIPLCVDLDGTLVRTDTIAESLFLLLKEHQGSLPQVVYAFLRGRAHGKQAIARLVELDVHQLPYRESLLDYLHQEHARGRTIVLATASPMSLARRIADHLGIFQDVIATTDDINISGSKKAGALVAKFGERGFDYIGNSAQDLHVWKHARKGIIVAAPANVRRAAQELHGMEVFPEEPARLWQPLWRTLRPHQWVKNVLVFVPLMMAHKLFEGPLLIQASIAWVAFSCMASALYIFNDLLDVSSDRRHPTKKHRPLATGEVSFKTAILTACSLIALGSLAGLLVSPLFLTIVGIYGIAVLLYSLLLKQMILLDVVFLSSLYLLRLFAGAVATQTPISFWLLAFALFFFLSLALVKRCTELSIHVEGEEQRPVHGRGYVPKDHAPLMSFGIVSGYLSVLVFALYINSADVLTLYERPVILWTLCPLLLYWISRIWLLVHRGEMHDDPIVFATKDPVSYLVGISAALLLILATP